MSIRPEPCNEQGCQKQIDRNSVIGERSRCGGILFGTHDDPGLGCGKFFCDMHLVGHKGPFYCQPCWDRKKKVAGRDKTLERSRFIDTNGALASENSLRRALEVIEAKGGASAMVATEALDEVYEAAPPRPWTK